MALLVMMALMCVCVSSQKSGATERAQVLSLILSSDLSLLQYTVGSVFVAILVSCSS
jgi:hypothetical protein